MADKLPISTESMTAILSRALNSLEIPEPDKNAVMLCKTLLKFGYRLAHAEPNASGP